MTGAFRGAIFDVDGVLVDSPHERAWAETLERLMHTTWADVRDRSTYSPGAFTYAVYQGVVAGKPRLSGARAALEHFAVPDAERRADEYAALKQQRVTELIDAGEFRAYPDALRFVSALRERGIRLAAASSSRNAALLLRRVRVGPPDGPGTTLLECFDADTSGRDLVRGKPDPEIFLAAAAELDEPPDACFVVEDAIVGVQAARAGGMAALAVARHEDEDLLARAGADLVVPTLDHVDVDAVCAGRLAERRVRV